MNFKTYITVCLTVLLWACSSSSPEPEPPTPPTPPAPVADGFAYGADISWSTQMEKSGIKLYNASGTEMEATALMSSLGFDAIRLRVWVNPSDGWCNKADVLEKARRASKEDMRLMIDFHYSDSWADPGKQTIPAAWSSFGMSELLTALKNHTTDVLQTLKDEGIDVTWVQVGNEVSDGMLWEYGRASKNAGNFVSMINAGYDAVKSIYPESKVIVQLDRGQNKDLYKWMFTDIIPPSKAKYDIIGMSIYPDTPSSWRTVAQNAFNNLNILYTTHQKPVMICEVGLPWDSENDCYDFLTFLISEGTKIPKKCLGVFYWEPQATPGWQGYTKGAMNNSHKPTKALDAFKH